MESNQNLKEFYKIIKLCRIVYCHNVLANILDLTYNNCVILKDKDDWHEIS